MRFFHFHWRDFWLVFIAAGQSPNAGDLLFKFFLFSFSILFISSLSIIKQESLMKYRKTNIDHRADLINKLPNQIDRFSRRFISFLRFLRFCYCCVSDVVDLVCKGTVCEQAQFCGPKVKSCCFFLLLVRQIDLEFNDHTRVKECGSICESQVAK